MVENDIARLRKRLKRRNTGRRTQDEQDQKWFGKNYDYAIRLYQQAIDLGSEAAKERLRRITAN